MYTVYARAVCPPSGLCCYLPYVVWVSEVSLSMSCSCWLAWLAWYVVLQLLCHWWWSQAPLPCVGGFLWLSACVVGGGSTSSWAIGPCGWLSGTSWYVHYDHPCDGHQCPGRLACLLLQLGWWTWCAGLDCSSSLWNHWGLRHSTWRRSSREGFESYCKGLLIYDPKGIYYTRNPQTKSRTNIHQENRDAVNVLTCGLQ